MKEILKVLFVCCVAFAAYFTAKYYLITKPGEKPAAITNVLGWTEGESVPSEISRRNTEPRRVPIRYLVIHGTANDSSYADAAWHHQYLDTTSREVSWHASIDKQGVVVHFPDSLVCYAASSRKMNHQSLNIELCQNGGKIAFRTIVKAAMYIQQKKKEYPNIRVIFHDEVPKYVDDAKLHGKVCPSALSRNDRQYLKEIK